MSEDINSILGGELPEGTRRISLVFPRGLEYTLSLDESGRIDGANEVGLEFSFDQRRRFSLKSEEIAADPDAQNREDVRGWKHDYVIGVLTDILTSGEVESHSTSTEPAKPSPRSVGQYAPGGSADEVTFTESIDVQTALDEAQAEYSARVAAFSRTGIGTRPIDSIYIRASYAGCDNDIELFIELAAEAFVKLNDAVLKSGGFKLSDIYDALAAGVQSGELELVDHDGKSIFEDDGDHGYTPVSESERYDADENTNESESDASSDSTEDGSDDGDEGSPDASEFLPEPLDDQPKELDLSDASDIIEDESTEPKDDDSQSDETTSADDEAPQSDDANVNDDSDGDSREPVDDAAEGDESLGRLASGGLEVPNLSLSEEAPSPSEDTTSFNPLGDDESNASDDGEADESHDNAESDDEESDDAIKSALEEDENSTDNQIIYHGDHDDDTDSTPESENDNEPDSPDDAIADDAEEESDEAESETDEESEAEPDDSAHAEESGDDDSNGADEADGDAPKEFSELVDRRLEKIASLKERNAQSRREFDENLRRVDRSRELASANRELDEARAHVEKLEQELASLKEERARNAGEIEEINAKLDDLDRSDRGLEAEEGWLSKARSVLSENGLL